ncbi:MAG TPA: catalase [Motilibacterales bacterium]|nr:catalase [Motilibacterales bacterium]
MEISRTVKDVASAGAAVVEAAVDKVVAALEPPVPGAPASQPPTIGEPTDPRDPLPPKADQGAPDLLTATGDPLEGGPIGRAQQGAYLTTSQGLRLPDSDHSLRAGSRGPTLLQDHHLREKITHFDHERIPERVVHARGAGAHGVFVANGAADEVCRAGFLAEGAETPVFVRFSTVVGSRGSADTVRDTRGFATKFYTEQGTFDLIGNNIPVFFIQDGIKFPDIVHAAKPHPDREIPQAQSAHDTFWDFVSLHTEAQHHTMWNMSDRGIPPSYRMMEGFGVHTFRLVDAAGATTLAKFHWKPVLGVHSLTWEEAQLAAGVDPDFHRRDLYDAIESGPHPQWDLGMQLFPDTPEQEFEGIDLLDPTKLVPEELAPVQRVGRMTLTAAPTNFFAETEQVAFHVGHLVPGIDVTDDPLLQARLFSYIDTQITRLGGPNFGQIPINRPHAPVNDMLRDGFHQHAVHSGVAPYRPNSLDGGCPFQAGEDVGGYVDRAVVIPPAARKVRESPVSFGDHFSQVRMFWASMAPVEQDHIVGAYTFELGKCYEEAIRRRQLQALANVDPDLCARVALGLGLEPPAPTRALAEVTASPALSQRGGQWPVDGRSVGIVVDPTGDLASLPAIRGALLAGGLQPVLVAATGGQLPDGTPVQRTFLTARSVEFDALLLAASPAAAPDAPAPARSQSGLDPRVELLITECHRQAKALGAWSAGEQALTALVGTGPGVVVGADPLEVVEEIQRLLSGHRVWQRTTAAPA